MPLTGAMIDALAEAGMPADGASTLGDLSLDQLDALQDNGLLDDLGLTDEDKQILQDSGLLSSGDGLDLGSSLTETPSDLGDLSGGQLSQLQSSGLLDDIPLTGEQIAELQADGLLGSDTTGIDSLGDLSTAQLQDLQRAGLLDDVDLTPTQLAELGVGGSGLDADTGGLGAGLGSGLGSGLGAGLGSGLSSSDPGTDGLGGGLGSGLSPDSFGSDTPLSSFPTAIDTMDVGGGGASGGLGADTGTPLKNVSAAMSSNMPGNTGLSTGGIKPDGELAGASNIGNLTTSMEDAQAADAAAKLNGTSGQGMMPMMPGMGNPGGGAQGKERERKTWLTEDEDVWGTDPFDAAPAVIGRSDADDDFDVTEEPMMPGFPSAPRPAPKPDHQRRPGRA